MGRQHPRNRRSHAALLEKLEQRRLLSASWADGFTNAMAYDAVNDKTWMAYYDEVEDDLRVTSKVGSGAWSTPEVIDNNSADNSNYGGYLAIALDRNNLPGIAYFDGENAELKYTHYNSTSGSFDPATLIDTNGNTGHYPSLDYSRATGSSNAIITYYHAGASYLRAATFNGSTWTSAILDIDPNGSTGGLEDIGRFSSVKYNPATQGWAVAYERTGNEYFNGNLRYATSTGGAWTKTSIYFTDFGGGYTSLAFNGNDPAFAFYDSTPGDLMYAKKVGANPWSVTRIAGQSGDPVTGTVGLYNKLYFESGKAQIVTYRKTAPGSVYLIDENASWAGTKLFDGGGSGMSAAEDSSGNILFTMINTDATGKHSVQFRSSAEGDYGQDFTQTTDSSHTRFSSRTTPGAAVFQGKMWVFGGNSGSGALGDLWNSTDGQTWTQETMTGDVPAAVHNPTMVVHSNGSKMWIIGGDGTPNTYRSTDGTAWTRMDGGTGALPSGLNNFSAVYYDGALWVLGGLIGTTVQNSVYKSTDDGATWSSVTPQVPFTAVYDSTAVVFNNQMWVVGGKTSTSTSGGTSNTWRSSDGVNWSFIAGNWTGRWGHALAVANDRLWMMGGNIGSGTSKNDVYYTLDGTTWVQSTGAAAFSARFYLAALGYDGKLFAVAGSSGGDEVWVTQ